LIWGFCYVVGLIFEFGFSCGLAEWVDVELISIEFDLLLNVDFRHVGMSYDLRLDSLLWLYGYVDYEVDIGLWWKLGYEVYGIWKINCDLLI